MAYPYDGDIDSARNELYDLLASHGEHDFDLLEQLESVKRIIDTFPTLCSERHELNGRLLLHTAVEKKCPLEILKLIVAAYPEAVNIGGITITPLHILCHPYYGDRPDRHEVFRLLASHEAVRTRFDGSSLPIHVCCRLHIVDLQVLQILLDVFPESIREVDDNGWAPLHFLCDCAHANKLPAIKYLLRLCPGVATTNIIRTYPDLETRKINYGLNLLHLACRGPVPHSLEVIRFLADKYPQAGNETCSFGRMPLHVLCLNMHHDFEATIVQFLLQKYPRSAQVQDNDGRTALHLCCTNDSTPYFFDSLPILALLIDANPDALTVKDTSSQTPLHLAILLPDRYTRGYSARVRILVEKCPAVLESNSERGTPLHDLYSQRQGHPDRLAYSRILAISERAVKARDGGGLTPLHRLCFEGGTIDECQVLLDKFPGLPNLQDNQGQTPLHMAVKGCIAGRQNFAIADWLLEVCPGSAAIADNSGTTPLLLACKNGHADSFTSLIYQLVRVNPIAALGLGRGRKRRPERDDANQSNMSERGGSKQPCRSKRLRRSMDASWRYLSSFFP